MLISGSGLVRGESMEEAPRNSREMNNAMMQQWHAVISGCTQDAYARLIYGYCYVSIHDGLFLYTLGIW